MRNPIHALINQVTCSMSPGEAKYETFRSDIFAATNTLMLVWGDLSEAVQLQWERVSANAVDPLMPPAARMWDAHATMTNNADIPLWENLPAHHRAAWEWVFSEQVGPSDIKPAKESEAMEQLRRIRGYSKCFTNAVLITTIK